MGKRLNSSNLQDNEILKASDINDGFDAQIKNVTTAFQALLEPKNDFVICSNELIEFHSDSDNDWTLNIGPILGVSQKTGQIFIEPEKSIAICSVPQASGYDRIDTIEVRGVYKKKDTEQRVFIDFDTKQKTIGYVETNRELQIEARVVNNGVASVVAPNHSPEWVKIGEIRVPADATKISDCTIYNITADVLGLENENWTNEKTVTYNVNYISEVNKRIRSEHHYDGTHRDAVIHNRQLDTGIGSSQVNGNNIPVGGITVVSGQEIAATESIYESIKIVASKITAIYNEYLKNGKYNYDREVVIKGDADNSYDVPAIKIGVNSDGSYYIKRGNKNIINILDGKIRVASDYVAENEYDLINKKVTNQLKNELNSLDDRVEILETNVDQTEFTNEVFSRYSINPTVIVAATNANMELKGPQTIDGVECVEDSIVLVKNQTNAKENGLYKVTTKETGWDRVTEYSTPNSLRNNLFVIQSGTLNKNKIYYCPIQNFNDGDIFGSDDIKFVLYAGAINPLKNTLVERDEKGHVKAAASTSANDCVIRSELFTKNGAVAKAIIDYIYPVGSLYVTASEENPGDTFGIGSWRKIEGKFIMGADGSHPNGSTGGNEYIKLTVKQLPAHTHTFSGTESDTGDNSVGHYHSYTPSGSITITANPSFAGDAITGSISNMDEDQSASGCFANSGSYVGWNPTGSTGDDAVTTYFSATPSGTISGGSYSFSGTSSNTGGISENHTHKFTASGSNSETGGGESIDMKPPYEAKNIWQRTA